MEVSGEKENYDEGVVEHLYTQKVHDQKIKHCLKSWWFVPQVLVHDDLHDRAGYIHQVMYSDQKSDKHRCFLMHSTRF